MTRKADIMYALIKEGMVSTAILRVDTGIQWLCKALDIEPSDAAIEDLLRKDDAV